MATLLCPEIAKPPGVVITIDNVDWLKLNTYARTPGTVVHIACLTAPEYKLVGASTLTCLSSGSWNFAIPVCKSNVVDPTAVGGDGSDISMVPVIVVCAILAVIFLAFVLVLLFATCFWRRAGDMIHRDQMAIANGRRGRSSRDFTTTNSLASFEPDPMPIGGGHYFGHRGGQPTEFKTRIGTRQTYRTWQDLFYSPDHY